MHRSCGNEIIHIRAVFINQAKESKRTIETLKNLTLIRLNSEEKFIKGNIIPNLLNTNKVFLDNKESFDYISNRPNLNSLSIHKIKNMDHSNFENPENIVKSKEISEDKAKSNIFYRLIDLAAKTIMNNLKIVMISRKK